MRNCAFSAHLPPSLSLHKINYGFSLRHTATPALIPAAFSTNSRIIDFATFTVPSGHDITDHFRGWRFELFTFGF